MKQGDHFYLNKIKHKIIKAYIIGKSCDLFEKKIKKNVNCVIVKTLNKAFKLAYKDALQKNIKESVILLSPAAASFDQFKNFQHRGEVFTKLAKEI
jgi:UDP-N-acetylmuramoylalanine--D-glutamate ligase